MKERRKEGRKEGPSHKLAGPSCRMMMMAAFHGPSSYVQPCTEHIRWLQQYVLIEERIRYM